MPMQSSPDYFFINIDYAVYPLTATEAERRIPIITVWVAAHFSPDGVVTHSWVLSSDGSAVFNEEALRAVKDWKIGWRVDPQNGRTLRIPFHFKSSYFTPDRPAR
jgi:TonB family protein